MYIKICVNLQKLPAKRSSERIARAAIKKPSLKLWKTQVLLDNISPVITFHKWKLLFLFLLNTQAAWKYPSLTIWNWNQFLCTVSISTYSVGLGDMESIRVLGRLVFQLSFTQKKNWHSLKLDFCTLAFSEIKKRVFSEES